MFPKHPKVEIKKKNSKISKWLKHKTCASRTFRSRQLHYTRTTDLKSSIKSLSPLHSTSTACAFNSFCLKPILAHPIQWKNTGIQQYRYIDMYTLALLLNSNKYFNCYKVKRREGFQWNIVLLPVHTEACLLISTCSLCIWFTPYMCSIHVYINLFYTLCRENKMVIPWHITFFSVGS